MQVDTLVWYFEDFKESIVIDSSWQKLLSDQQLFKHQQDFYTKKNYIDTVDYDLSTDTLKHRLALLNANTPLDISYSEDLERLIQYYLKREKQNTEKLIRLSQYYFPMFERIFDKHNIPLEIKYLALVESALNPRAKSWVGATGLWQFMYHTGRMYDLDVSSYVDERMDPIRSTEAAAKYLKHLYDIFEDWDLALAAYNSGPGNVNKAIRRSGGQKDYWSIRPYLPRETSAYVPSFLAMLYIFEYAEAHDYQPHSTPMPYLATDTIQTKNLIKLEQVAEITNTNIEFLKFLNPSYKLGIIPYEPEKKYTIRLPYKAAGLFVANENKFYDYAQKDIAASEETLPQYYKVSDKIRYRVRRGDYLGKIAKRYGVRVSEIKRWNGMRNNRINISDRLTIYPRKANYTQTPIKKKSTHTTEGSKTTSAKSKTYTVKPGDSLWSISKQFEDLSVEDLKRINNLNNVGLKPGMRLKISS
ncbi:MAG: LysM peptidoglycan-binding domain-containing protein [Psychroflexus sp.]|uniref:LysM peptidoglycan-binding domain-containing protein n=2 Tax=Mesohalobacter halotolerans TaxID=1883405 RepID=A0A4U5TTH4_9FLAO|nr:LysM peptidoglycan-binding domain-containing protein [Psychroflexus sp.]TKS57679.1 LysM peptidoglycan-binding domain-containing protein [Mesohalobacter halotolerans]